MKNVIIFNNRSLHLYDFKELKDNHDLRISVVVFEKYYKSLSNDLKKKLDEIYVLPEPTSNEKFLSFSEELLSSFIEKKLCDLKNTWIVTPDELSVLNVASARNKYNLPGPSKEVILNYKNKAIQKEVLKKHKVRTPNFITCQNNLQQNEISALYSQFVQKLKVPFILKPINMGGTIGVERIENYDDFCNYFIRFPYFSHLIAEEFIDEQLYHCDFVIYEGEYIISEVFQYLYNGLAFIKGCNHGSLLLQVTNPLREVIIEFCKKANSILGLQSGCAHFEVFITKKQEIIFLEAAGRPAGSGVPLVFTQLFKSNYMNAALLAEIEENPGVFNRVPEHYFWACFPKIAGTIKSLNQPSFHSPYQLEWYIKKGDALDSPSLSVVEKIGMLVANNYDYEVLKSDFYSIKTFKAIEME